MFQKWLESTKHFEQVEMVEMVRRAKARDHDAFIGLYECYKQSIWNRLTYLLRENRESVYDLFQETFLRAWDKISTIDDETRFEPWLHRIAVNIALDYLRREKLLRFSPLPKDDAEEQISPVLLSTVGIDERVGENECIELTLQCLSPRYRICLLLYDQWGFSQREIAILLHISEKSVSAYISRGREKFRQHYLDLIRK